MREGRKSRSKLIAVESFRKGQVRVKVEPRGIDGRDESKKGIVNNGKLHQM